jgi:hypothetical protein
MAIQQAVGGNNISVQKVLYNDSQMTDTNSLANAALQRPTELSPIITHLAGRNDERFPLTFLSEGMGNVKTIDTNEYEYRVMTRELMTRPIAQANPGVNIGQGGSTFELVFPDKWFIKDYVLVNSQGEQARVMAEPTPVIGGSGYTYTLKLINPNPAAVLTSGFTQGDLWAQLFAPVGTDFSRGNASNWQSPGKVRNKLTKVRKSYHMSGSARNFVAEFSLPKGKGQTTKMWMDYEEYQHMLKFKEECEYLYWYGQRSYDASGNVNLTDENGQPIVIGPGLLDQIINRDTYAQLTENQLLNVIGDLFYGMTDASAKNITLYTGTGGMREFDTALKGFFGSASNSWQVSGETRFITGSGRSLGLTGYFKRYDHIDGHTVNVVKVPMFDHGAVAKAAGLHPVTGYSLESYRMVFVDMSQYDGQNNLQMVSKRGEEYSRWAVAGSVVPRGFESSSLRASDVDGASVHMMKTGGVALKRFDTSLDLRCVAS